MLEIILRWGWLLSMLLSGALTWVVWSLAAHFVGQKDCNLLRLGDNNAREKTDTKLWAAIEDLKDQQHGLELKMVEVQGSLQAARAEMSGTKEVMLRVESNVKLLLRGHLGHEYE